MNPTRLFGQDLEAEEIDAIFSFYGFRRPMEADKKLAALVKQIGGDVFFLQEVFPLMLNTFKGTADPDRVFNNLIRFLENTPTPFIHFSYVTRNPPVLKLLFRIFSDSQFFADILIKYPEYLDWLLQEGYGRQLDLEALLGRSRQSIADFSSHEEQLMALRRFQKKELLRIGANDLLEKSSLEQTTLELSLLADVCIQIIYEIKKAQLEEKQEFSGELAVISMGKMGGLELNYSSDIDLIFVGEGSMETLSMMAAQVGKELSRFTEEGYFYRVDTRLRPEGERGQLVRNLESFQSYFDNRARIWERQAYLKARFSAGNKELGRKFMEMTDHFIFRKYLSSQEIDTIKQLKKGIESKALKKQHWTREVKIGYGGIRDIEFFVQFIQLLYAAQHPELKTGNTLKALANLNQIGFIAYDEYLALSNHYIFLRRVEHFLQIVDYQQTHLLPEDPQERGILAKKMGFQDTVSFQVKYQDVTEQVRNIFKKYFENLFEKKPDQISDMVFSSRQSEEGREFLRSFGFQDVDRMYHLIRNTGSNAKNQMLFSSIMEDIFKALGDNSFDADRGLVNIIRIIKAYRGEDVFFDIIRHSPSFLETLVKIASFSGFMVDIIEHNPAVLDFLTEPMVFKKPSTKKELERIFQYLREELELPKALSTLYEMEIFRIGVQDLLGLKTQRQIAYNLSILAETILFQAWKELAGPTGQSFALIFFGKLGGRELSYHSDLDLMMIAREEDYESIQHLTTVLQKVIKAVKGIYEVDLRLRPGGKNAPAVLSFSHFQRYLNEKAEPWEKLIYSRARIYADSFSFRSMVKGAVDHFLKHFPKDFKAKVIEMREKIARAFSPSDFKKGPGGIIDIEFILEYFKIQEQNSQLNLHHLSKKLRRKNGISGLYLDNLSDCLHFLRELENAIRLLSNYYSSKLPENPLERRLLALKMGFRNLESFLLKYEEIRETIRHLWERFKEI